MTTHTILPPDIRNPSSRVVPRWMWTSPFATAYARTLLYPTTTELVPTTVKSEVWEPQTPAHTVSSAEVVVPKFHDTITDLSSPQVILPVALPVVAPVTPPVEAPMAQPTALPVAQPTAQPTALPVAAPMAPPVAAPVEEELTGDSYVGTKFRGPRGKPPGLTSIKTIAPTPQAVGASAVATPPPNYSIISQLVAEILESDAYKLDRTASYVVFALSDSDINTTKVKDSHTIGDLLYLARSKPDFLHSTPVKNLFNLMMADSDGSNIVDVIKARGKIVFDGSLKNGAKYEVWMAASVPNKINVSRSSKRKTVYSHATTAQIYKHDRYPNVTMVGLSAPFKG